jgi:hypothetical protein
LASKGTVIYDQDLEPNTLWDFEESDMRKEILSYICGMKSGGERVIFQKGGKCPSDGVLSVSAKQSTTLS